MRRLTAFFDLNLQRGYLFPWAAVFYGAGIGLYFALKTEPGATTWGLVALSLVAVMAMVVRVSVSTRPWFWGLALLLAGFAAAGGRAHLVAGQVLEFRYYGPIEGRIVGIDRSTSDALRLTLDHVNLGDIGAHATPERVRISLHGQQGFFSAEPGLTVFTTGHLSPPGGAVEPGGFDFRRHAWFQRLGAVGYTRSPVLVLAPHEGDGVALALYRLRMRISAAVQAVLPGRAGAFAAAVTTGDRSSMDGDTLEALRASNLAHLLAISGLHMGLLSGFVFAAIRVALAFVPRVSLFMNAKKIAAVGALAAGAGYLALSGGNVATERAFIMVAVMFGAILVDRRAITLRSVALAALIVLSLRPEALYGPGFQMSFAATTALVAVFGEMRGRNMRGPFALRVFTGVALSSLVAGLATAPVAAAHFNQVPHYGLIANIVSVPLMGALIIPGAVLAALLAPFGLAWIGLKVMEAPILWILWVADTVSGWHGALSFVVSPSREVVPVLVLGALWIVLWQGWGRLAGVPVIGVAMALWSASERPYALVSQSGGLVGIMTEEGRALSKPRGDGFSAQSWLENDGDGASQEEASDRSAFVRVGRRQWFNVGAAKVVHATGKSAAALAVGACHDVDLVVVNVPAREPEGCRVYDIRRLDATGALALQREGDALVIVTAQDVAGTRLWSP